MFTIRLKHAFCLLLVVALCLMWWMWARGTTLTANRLLVAREILKAKPLPDSGLTDRRNSAPIPSDEARRLLAEAGIEEPYTFSNLARDIQPFDSYYLELWEDDCRLMFDGYVGKGPPKRTEFAFHWEADWPTIEAKARQENWTFYRQVIVTALSGLAIAWAMWPRGMRYGD